MMAGFPTIVHVLLLSWTCMLMNIHLSRRFTKQTTLKEKYRAVITNTAPTVRYNVCHRFW